MAYVSDEHPIPFDPPAATHLPTVEVDGVDPPWPLLLAEEVDWYRWLIDGLLAGVARLMVGAERRDRETAHVAIEATRELFDELMVRIQGEET